MSWIADVSEFFHKHCFPRSIKLQDCNSDVNSQHLIHIGRTLKELSKSMIHPATISAGHGDHRLLRAQIQLEETGELLVALGEKNQVETLDALIDSIYASIGTALMYGMPIGLGWERIHESNMSKAPCENDPRLKSKNKGYIKPYLEDLF